MKPVYQLIYAFFLIFSGVWTTLAQTSIPPGTSVRFARADRCGGNKSGEASPVAFAGHSCDKESFTVRAYSMALISAIGAVNPKAESFTENTFTLKAGNTVQPVSLDASITAEAEWDGILGGLGIGATSKVTIGIECLDAVTNLPIGGATFHDKDGGGIDPKGSASTDKSSSTVTFPVKLTRGRSYKLRFVLKTEAQVGVIGGLVVSAFSNESIAVDGLSVGNRYARLNSMGITIDPDLIELVTMVKDQVTQLQSNVGDLSNSVNQGFNAVRTDISNVSQTANAINRNTIVMIDQLNTLQSSVNNANTKLDTLNNKSDTIISKVDETNTNVNIVGGKVDDLAKKLLEFQRRALRSQIEQALVEGDRYNVASFQLPQAAGGNLEEVRSVVAEVIEIGTKAGAPSSAALEQAKNALQIGDVYFNTKAYKDAYDQYRAAYLFVATVIGNHRP